MIVVVGSNAELIMTNMSGVKVIENKGWAEGISSSIRAGLKCSHELEPAAEGVMLMVCDQPYLDSSLLRNIVRTQQETCKPIVACDYGGSYGTPALFHKTFFPQLELLTGDSGAKKIMDNNRKMLELVPFPLGHIDIDNKSDYELLQKYSEK